MNDLLTVGSIEDICYACHVHSGKCKMKQMMYVRLLRHVRREWALLSFHSVCLSGCLSVIPRPTMQRVFLPLQTWRIVPYDLSVCLSVSLSVCLVFQKMGITRLDENNLSANVNASTIN